MSSWNDFNDAPAQPNSLIPKGTLAKVRLSINPGEYNDPDKGWTRGYATKSRTGSSVWLSCDLTILDGIYEGRKIFGHKIGLYSPKSEVWGNMGRAQIKALLNSHYGLKADDMSDEAKAKRNIRDFADLQNKSFVIKIGIEDYQSPKKDEHGIIIIGRDGNPILQDRQKNTLDYIIEPDEPGYQDVMNSNKMNMQEATTALYKKDDHKPATQIATSPGQPPEFDDDIPF